jgi:ubiquinone/menaquinone biosynthesis C-methylase UbiE
MGEKIVEGNWIKKNWDWHKNNVAARIDIAKRILSHGGLILEIGTGPGGGYMPSIFLENKNANIIISDLSPTVVREWKNLFKKELFPPNVQYAALDNCDLPFENNSIDVISAGGGFGNIEGNKFKALREIYRVLKPGGLYISGDGYVTQENLKSFSNHIQKILLEKRPDIFEDFYDATVTAGFKTIDNTISFGWSTKNDESAVADLARELGIDIIFSGYLRYCVK